MLNAFGIRVVFGSFCQSDFSNGAIICEDLTKRRGLCLRQQTNEELRFVYTAFLVLNPPTLVIKMLSVLPVWEDVGDVFPDFRGKEWKEVRMFLYLFLSQAVSQLNSTFSNMPLWHMLGRPALRLSGRRLVCFTIRPLKDILVVSVLSYYYKQS